MEVLSINGSPHGKSGNTAVMVDALLEGCRAGGARTVSVDLADLSIAQCRGCHACWFKHPGICVQADDMGGVLEKMRGAEIFLFATPVHFLNVSGHLKTFFDRLTAAGGNPHDLEASTMDKPSPQYVMVGTSGFPGREQFDLVSRWVRQIALLSRAQLLAEFYAPGGKILLTTDQGQAPARDRYLAFLRECGAALGRGNGLTPAMSGSLSRNILDF